MNGTRYRSQLRTNVPSDTRISGRFSDGLVGAAPEAMTVVEGKQYYATRTAVGTYKISFGPSATNADSFKGLVSFHGTVLAADPATAAKNRWVQVKSVDLNANGTVASVTIVLVDKDGAVASVATANDQILFECVVRSTEILV